MNQVDRANAYIKGIMLGVDGCSLTNYLVDFPKLVTNATEPICRLLGQRNEEPIVEMKESRVLPEVCCYDFLNVIFAGFANTACCVTG